MLGFFLYLIASIIKWVLAPGAYIYGFVASIVIGNGEFDRYHHNLAVAKDQYGNALCKHLFNWTLIKKEGYKFGNIDETISSVIGKNKLTKTLTICGKILDRMLDFFDHNHSIDSIDNTEGNDRNDS